MNHKEAVESKIAGEADELHRRRELWEGIATAYEQGGQGAIESLLAERGNTISEEFEELLSQLREEL